MYSASSRRFDVAAPSQSVTLCARKSHPDAIADRDVPLPNLLRKGLVFRFSTLVPRSLCPRIPHTSLHPCDFPVPRLISDHRSSFVRSVMGVPLLSGREHAHKKTGKKSSPLVLIRSLHLVHSTLPFFGLVQVFGLRSVSLSMQSPLPVLRPNVPLRCFRDLLCHSDPVN